MRLTDELRRIIKGDIDDSKQAKQTYSHDASLFELVPEVVVFPKDSEDIQAITKFIIDHKNAYPELSITPRTRGTCMSGGSIGQSIVLDVSRHMTTIETLTKKSAQVQPGIMYRDFEKKTLEKGVLMPSYPASRELAGIGGMVSNNCGGEKSLEYGKIDNFVQELSVVLADGNEYVVKPLQKAELDKKMAQGDYEGELYKKTFELVSKHHKVLQAARPNVTKDSTGYHLWNIWNPETEVFDLTKLFVGAQGTLGIITDVKLKLVPQKPYSGTLVGYLPKIDRLGELIPAALREKPATFECFDDNTLWLSIKFIFLFIKRLGFVTWLKMCLQLIPDGLALVKGIPKLIVLIEFSGETQEEVTRKIHEARQRLARFDFSYLEEDETREKSRKFWLMRRESFNLLRSKVKDKHTAPFIDDFCVPPEHLSAFLPKLRRIIKKYKLFATITGHLGDGNFHVIPLMKIEDPKERKKFKPAMTEVNRLALKYGGSISGEHNDGMIRGPWLEEMYGKEVFELMKKVKQIYDPQNIFNPHKKTDATWDFSLSHIRDSF